MRKMILSAMAFGLVLSLTGCGEKPATPAAPAAPAMTDKPKDAPAAPVKVEEKK